MSQQTKCINWGIIGLGSIAHKFAQDLINLNDSKLYAVASRTQEKADAFALKYNATKAYATYEDLANDPNVDAVYIATPHILHKANTILCLKKGKAVLCEKPFAMNTEEVEDMIACAKANNTLLMEALWTHFLPHYQFVINAIKNKIYGRVLSMEASFGFYRDFDGDARLFKKELGGGVLLDIGIYPIFAALSTLGIPKSIKANATFFDNGADSSNNIMFHYEDVVAAKLKGSLLEEVPCEAIFNCEKATIKINRQWHAPTTVTVAHDETNETFDFDYKTLGYNFETSHFNNLIKAGKTESDIMSFDFSRTLIKLLDEVRNIINLHY
ncbi:MAG: Gfo/Idh/MocA family protein [Tamlana sp.]